MRRRRARRSGSRSRSLPRGGSAIDTLLSRGRSLRQRHLLARASDAGLRRLGAIPVSLRRSSARVRPLGRPSTSPSGRGDSSCSRRGPRPGEGGADAHGASVNDVLSAAVAGGTRALLLGRGELTPGAEAADIRPGIRADLARPAGRGEPRGADDRPPSRGGVRPRPTAGGHRARDRRRGSSTRTSWDPSRAPCSSSVRSPAS